jgi:hypothetical protein
MALVILTVALLLLGALAIRFGADSRSSDRPALR